MRALSALAGALLLLALSPADIDYRVVINPEVNDITVRMTIPAQGEKVSIQIPNWAPGSYRLVENFRLIRDVTATRGGQVAQVENPDDNTWVVPDGATGDVTISYRIARGPNTERMHLTGPATYLYVVDRKEEPCTVEFQIPESWDTACGLEGVSHRYTAPDYDTLADNPVTVGIFESDTYTSNGVPHQIVYFGGDVKLVDRAKVIQYCQEISDAQARFWGGLPFSKYVWHFTISPGQDGGWGLEHLSSTTIGLAAGLGKGTVSVMSHELFHAWNVKRIRPRVLGPFDYLQLPKTGALWFSEGVTDYYADLLLYRYGTFDERHFLDNIVSNTRNHRNNNQRLEISPYDASYRVGEAANGRGNSSGLGISYYTVGWLLGLCLDAELRTVTNGQYSLDDVLYRLWEQCRDDQPGFEEGDIRKILVELGGEHMGDRYDEWVMKPGELPIEAQATKLGYELKTVDEAFDNPGFEYRLNRTTGVTAVVRDVEELGLRRGDELVKVGTIAKAAEVGESANIYDQWQKQLTRGKTVEVTFRRGNQEFTKSITVREAKRPVLTANPAAAATPEQLAHRRALGRPRE